MLKSLVIDKTSYDVQMALQMALRDIYARLSKLENKEDQ